MHDKSPTIIWFRNDLRLTDNPSIDAAVRAKRPVVFVYIFDSVLGGDWAVGGASRWWLHHSLADLDDALQRRGARLLLLSGNTFDVLTNLVEQVGASAVYCNRLYEPWQQVLERRLHDSLEAHEVSLRRFSSYLLREPDDIKNGQGLPYKVFTPFWRTLKALPLKKTVSHAKNFDQAPIKKSIGETLTSWKLLPQKPNWAKQFTDWQPGERGAHKRLKIFIKDDMLEYDKQRDLPASPGTSALSPHLHFGELSPRYIWKTVRQHLEKNRLPFEAAEPFLRQLGWREFSYHLLCHWPDLSKTPFKEKFAQFPWRRNKKQLKAWQRGQTGFPLIDAGMRQLWASGWMHNRVRMVVASLLTKNLGIHWREGEEWFWDTLLDADLANNAAGWQWVAGCGADAAPYFRIFNPVTQSEKFDPNGDYIREWVPELRRLSNKHIHKPWDAPEAVLKEAEVTLGNSYPERIVDLKTTREQALQTYKDLV